MSLANIIKNTDPNKTTNTFGSLLKKSPAASYDIDFNDRPNVYDPTTPSKFLNNRFNPYTNVQEGGAEEMKAQSQSGWLKAGAIPLRALAKAGTEVMKMPGILAGIGAGAIGQIGDLFTGEDNTDFMKTAFNNGWIKSMNSLNETINTELLPVYVKKSIKEGGLWDNITSLDFWATEGADGIGYIASMMIPGTIIAKYSLGTKMANMLGKTQKARKVLDEIGFAGNKADVALATLGNTIFEAGVEAQGAMDHYRHTIESRGFLPETDPNYLSPEQVEEYLQKESIVGRNVFLANAAILLGPNAIMAKMMHGTKGTGKLGENLYDPTTRKLVDNVNPQNFFKGMGKRVGTAFVSEGFWEEGMQTTAENYFISKEANPDYNKNFMEAYGDMLGTTEGHKAIFLGGILGGGMMTYQGRMSDVKEAEVGNKLLDYANKGINTFTDFHKTDMFQTKIVDGKTVLDLDFEGKPKINPVAFFEKAEALEGALDDNALYQYALSQGDTKTAEMLQEKAIAGYVLNFVQNEGLGTELLQKHLEDSGMLDEILKDSTNPEKDKKEFVDKVMKKAETLKSAREMFTNFQGLIKLNNPEATEEDIKNFQNNLYSSYMNTSNSIDYLTNQLQEVQKKKALYFKNSPHTESDLDGSNELLKQQLLKDERLKNIRDEETTLKNTINTLKEKESKFFRKENYNTEFNDFVEKNKKIRELSNEENVAKADEVINQVNNVETIEELEKALNIEDTSIEDTKLVDDIIKQKEFDQIKQASKSIEEDPSVENLERIANFLFTTKFNNYNVQKLIDEIQKRINTFKKDRRIFADFLEKLIDEQISNYSKTQDKLNNTVNSIDELTKVSEQLIAFLNNTPNKFIGRNAKKAKEIYNLAQKQLETIEETLTLLKEEKNKLEKELDKINKEVEIIYSAKNINKNNPFQSLKDLIKFLKQDLSQFEEHRFDVQRLELHKFYTEQNIEGLENSIDKLEYYRDILKDKIITFFDKDGNFNKGVKSEDYKFIKDELINTTKELFYAKKELEQQKNKLKGLENALLDKSIMSILSEEIEFWEKFDSFTKTRPSSIFTNPVINKLIENKKEELNQKEEEKADNIKKDNEEYSAVLEEDLNALKNDYKVGDLLTIKAEYNTDKRFVNQIVTITKITGNLIHFKTDNNVTSVINLDKLTTNNIIPENEFSTEGGIEESYEETLVTDSQIPGFTTNGSKVISVDDKGTPLSFVNDSFIEFERNPLIEKVGQKVTFEINNEATQTDNWRLALIKFHRNDFSDLDFLINHLPINVVFENGQKAPIETYYVNAENSSEAFNTKSKILRSTILKELAKGTQLTQLSTVVEGQYNGELQVTTPNVLENKIFNLYEFGNNIDNVKVEDIFIVNDQGSLKNIEDKTFPTNRKLSPGEIYIKIHTSNGTAFPLKLNVKKINVKQAEILYDLYKYRFEDVKTNNKGKTLKEIDNSELLNSIQENLKDELEVLNKNFNDITIKDLVDFLIWDGTDSVKSRVKFKNTKGNITKLAVMNKVFTAEEFNTSKEEFVKLLTSTQRGQGKRHHIKFKPKANEDLKAIHLKNPKYFKYLLEKGILNTNAVTTDEQGNPVPTFQGKTNIYLNSFEVKVDDVLSTFNPERIVEVNNKELLGSNNQLKSLEPSLFNKTIKLNEDEKTYTDGKITYQRASDLKSETKDSPAPQETSVRGNTIDELIRLQLSSLVTPSKEEFINRGKLLLQQENTKRKTNLIISDKAFSELYDVLEMYKKEFTKRNWFVFANTPTIGGQLGNKGMYAGTMDLLVYDKKTKEYIIVDIKTTSVSRAQQYSDITKDKWKVKEKDKIQQMVYAELFKQTTGKEISKIFILPLIIPNEAKGSYNVNEVKVDSELFLEVDMFEDIYQLRNIDKSVKTKTQTNTEIDLDDSLLAKNRERNKGLFDITDTTPTSKTEEIQLDDTMLENNKKAMNHLFDMDIAEEAKTVVTPKVETKVESEEQKKLKLLTSNVSKYLKDNKNNPTKFITLKTKDNTYTLFVDLGILTLTNKGQGMTIIQDINKAISIINEYNKNEHDDFNINVKSVLNNWNSQFKSVSLQDKPVVQQISTPVVTQNIATPVVKQEALINKANTVTEEQAGKLLKTLMTEYIKPIDFKNVQAITKSETTNLSKFKKVFDYVNNKLNAEEQTQLRKKCNL